MDSGIYIRKCILEKSGYIPGKSITEIQNESGVKNIARLALNENPLGTSSKAIEAMIEEIKRNSCRYPDSICKELIAKLARKHKVNENQIYVDNGGDAVITKFGLTFFNPDDEIISADITFPDYEDISKEMGAKFVKVPLNHQGYFDLSAVLAKVTQKTKCIFICNPNNPTGSITPEKDILEFLDKVPQTSLVFLDEAYIDFIDKDKQVDYVRFLSKYENLVIMRTFSKVMGLASVRCGYCIAHQEIINMIMRTREPFSVNSVAQAGAVAALDDMDFYNRTIENNKTARNYFYNEFDKMGLKYYESQTNFVCVDIQSDSINVANEMLHDGVVVRPLASQGMPNCLRITFGLPDENTRAIVSLRKALKNM